MLPYKRTKFSPSNVAEQELTFIHMHNVAMGYVPRENSSNPAQTGIIALANATFPVPELYSLNISRLASYPTTSEVRLL